MLHYVSLNIYSCEMSCPKVNFYCSCITVNEVVVLQTEEGVDMIVCGNWQHAFDADDKTHSMSLNVIQVSLKQNILNIASVKSKP